MRLAAAIVASILAGNAVLVAAIVADDYITRRRRARLNDAQVFDLTLLRQEAK